MAFRDASADRVSSSFPATLCCKFTTALKNSINACGVACSTSKNTMKTARFAKDFFGLLAAVPRFSSCSSFSRNRNFFGAAHTTIRFFSYPNVLKPFDKPSYFSSTFIRTIVLDCVDFLAPTLSLVFWLSSAEIIKISARTKKSIGQGFSFFDTTSESVHFIKNLEKLNERTRVAVSEARNPIVFLQAMQRNPDYKIEVSCLFLSTIKVFPVILAEIVSAGGLYPSLLSSAFTLTASTLGLGKVLYENYYD